MKYNSIKILLLLPILVYSQAVDPRYITLSGDITNPNQELSGLTWYNDNLILLPQYPKDKIYSIPKTKIIEFIESYHTTILPNEISWKLSCTKKKIRGFEGYESIIFHDDTVYVTIEVEKRRKNYGLIESGIFDKSKNVIIIDNTKLKKIKTPVTLRNMTYETLLFADNSIIAIYEVNAKNVNRSPIYYQFDKELKSYITKSFPFTEYRITDATAIDSSGKFWVISYFWPGDFSLLKPELDYPIINKKDIKPVEQLLEFQIIDGKITRTQTPSVKLNLSKFGDSRNWEGIVRLDDRGFLIVTDKFPGTILAFIPYSE